MEKMNFFLYAMFTVLTLSFNTTVSFNDTETEVWNRKGSVVSLRSPYQASAIRWVV